MVDALERGVLDGFCAGDPWHAVAEARGAGETVVATSEIWPNHPEKVLACRREFVQRYPATARALVRTMLEACRWVDAPEHRDEISAWLAKPDALDVPRELIAPRLAGREGGKRYARAPLAVSFFDGGSVNYPRVAEGRWFLAQYRRWGLLRPADAQADDATIAASINQTALYREAAARSDVPVPPAEETQVDRFCDGASWR